MNCMKSFVFVMGLVVTACELVSRDQVAVLASPAGHVEAVLIETNGGATTSFGYEIWIRARTGGHQEEIARLYGAVRNENAYGANLRWATDNELIVEYLEALSANLVKPKLRMAGQDFRIMLKPGVEDRTAPSGGMLYNLRRQ